MRSRVPPDIESRLAEALSGVNSGYVQDMYDRYLASPSMVGEEWRQAFANGAGDTPPGTGPMSTLAAAAAPSVEGNGQQAAPPPSDQAAAPGASQAPAGATLLRGPSARLAANMAASLAIPTATSFREIDVAVLEAQRRTLNDALKPRKVSFTHLIGFAIVAAAKTHATMRHYFAQVDGQPHRVDPGTVNLGLAVDVERADGTRFLVVPVIKGADSMDFATFHATYESLVEKARTNKLSPDDLQGATITLTNPGTLGTSASVPRLMPGQGTIVAAGAIRQGGSHRVMTISSTYDHRVIQGAESGAFLRTIEHLLGGGERFYDEVFASLNAGQPGAWAAAPEPTTPSAAASVDELRHVAAAMALVEAYRGFGHLAAHLDPLGGDPPGEPALDPRSHGLTAEIMDRIPADVLGCHVPGETLSEILPELASTYCGTMAYEVEHIASHDERAWLRRVIESGAHRRTLTDDEKRRLLSRLIEVEALERFLHRAYLGQKRFSIEGLDVMVPMLELLVDMAGGHGAREVMIGMAHRGRLNVLAQIVGLPLESLFTEFEAGRHDAAPLPEGGMDDVKYHLGAVGTRQTSSGHEVTVRLIPNPSHLEAVDPVVEGSVRAKQTDRSGPTARQDASVTLPLLIHGDAAFAAQGVVAETFNLERLPGYSTGGTIHLISNNQLGFTTGPSEGRSTLYASDLAKGFDVPIVHVNADDAEACLAAVRLAMVYRKMFGGDVVIDLVGYRRYGHNEGDEPSYTQPEMYSRIDRQPTARQRYQEQLVTEGVVDAEQAEADLKAAQRRFAAIQRSLAEAAAEHQTDAEGASQPGGPAAPAEPVEPVEPARTEPTEPDTSVEREVLLELNRELHSWPEGFNVHPKLVKQIERRRDAFDAGNAIEWGHAEALAFGSLVADGVPIRLTGQDTVRGTFSQRHATLYDVKTGEPYTPVHHLSRATASFELHNSPLSEYACMGFEYGYAVTVPEALVVWEAQYGDFANNGAVIIDQFIIAGLAKWGQTSRLTLLLPHGYEGAGPEHSSARLERFLALGAEGNIRVANASTAAQYFHLLRRQAHHADARPLVVMTPKSLLRLAEASSSLDELVGGRFEPVLDDPGVASEDRYAEVRRLVLCSGKVYYDMLLSEERERARHVAIGRVELLYPFPTDEIRALLGRYPALEEIVWVQEEPRNMGARKFVRPKLDELAPSVGRRSITRPERSRPAEGYARAHQVEQARIVREALAG